MARPISKSTPRTPASYDSRTDGTSDSSRPPDDYTINSECAATVIRPKYKEGPIIFRPFPCLRYEDPTQLDVGRSEPEPKAYTHWHVRLNVAAYIGLPGGPKYTFNLHHPRDLEAKNNNPYRIFYFACAQAFKSAQFGNGKKWNADWNKFMSGDSKGGAAIDLPASMFFFTGAVWRNGKRDYLEKKPLPYGLNPDDKLPIIQVKASGGHSAIQILDTRKDEFDGDEELNKSIGFTWGDPVGTYNPESETVAGGVFITFFNPKVNGIVTVESKKVPGKLLLQSSWDGKTVKTVQGYEAAISRTHTHGQTVWRPDLDAAATAKVIKEQDFWFDDEVTGAKGMLRIAPIEQQALWVAQAYKGAPSLVRWAWSEKSEFFTDEVKGVLASRVTMVVPGTDENEATVADEVQVAEDDEAAEAAVEAAEAAPVRKSARQDPTVRRAAAPPPQEEDEEEAPEATEEDPDEVVDEAVDEVVDDTVAEIGEEDVVEYVEEAVDATEDTVEDVAEDEDEVAVDPAAEDGEDEFADPVPPVTRVVKPAAKPAGKPTAAPVAKPATKVAASTVKTSAPTGAAKVVTVVKPAPAKAAQAKAAPATSPVDDYFDEPTAKSLRAADEARARSAARAAPTAVPAPKKPPVAAPAAVVKKPIATTVPAAVKKPVAAAPAAKKPVPAAKK